MDEKNLSIFKCKNCNYTSQRKHNLIRHMISKHQDEDDSEKSVHEESTHEEEKDICVTVTTNEEYNPLDAENRIHVNITENNIDEIMLCQIPGISSQIAKSIISHFGSLQNMFLQYSVDGESILSNIRISRKNSSECKLNKTVITNILKYLFKK